MSSRSDDIFHLVKSLTWSEYYTLIDDVAKSMKSNAKGDTPATYLQIIQYLRDQESYDEEALKTHFGYAGKEKSVAWRTLKRSAIKRILTALERANGNANPRSTLQRIPNLINTLLEKEAWQRAESLVDKHIEIAAAEEEYDRLVQLLDIKQHIAFTYYPRDEAVGALARLGERRNEVMAIVDDERRLNSIWFEIGLMARAGANCDKERVRELLGSKHLEGAEKRSRKARLYYWNIQRTGNFLIQDHPGYINGLDGGIEFAVQYLRDSEVFELFLNSISDRIRNHLFQHNFEEVETLVSKTISISDEQKFAPYRMTRVESMLFAVRMLHDRLTLDSAAVRESCKEFDSWIAGKRFQLDERMWHKMIFRGAINLFFVGEFAMSAKWIIRIRSGKPSNVNPQLTHFAWVLFLMARFSQGEREIVGREIKATEKYLTKSLETPELYLTVVRFIKGKIKRTDDANSKRDANLAALEIETLLESKQYQPYKDFFPFALWLRSETHEAFKRSLLEATQPFTFGQ